MNPTQPEQPGLSLPKPFSEQPPAPAGLPESGFSAPEMSPQASQTMPQLGTANNQIPQINSQQLGQPMPLHSSQPAVGISTQTNIPAVADDSDLIEKEWVNKAKQIVERTKDDPHTQSQELTVFKADYMKKRYNKEIKSAE